MNREWDKVFDKCCRLSAKTGLFDPTDLTDEERDIMWALVGEGYIQHVWEMRLYQSVDTESASQAGAVEGRRYKGERLDIKDPGNPIHMYMYSESVGFEVSKAARLLIFPRRQQNEGRRTAAF